MTRYAGPAMLAGTYAMFSFEVTCEPMDLEISFRKGADETRARRSDGEAAATTYADEDDEARFILRRGALEHPEMLGVYANDSLSFGLFPHEDALNADVDAIDVGVWYLQIVVISGSLRSGFEISHRLFGSRLARFADFNGCELDDGTLSVTVRSINETYTRREPFVAEPDYGACGNDTNSCYLGEQHSGDENQGRGAERAGTGPVSGRAVVAMSTPVAFDDEYFLLAGDARKFLGNFSTGWFTTDGFLNATLTSEPRLLAQMVPNRTSAPFDHEACGTMLNAADLRGAVCVTSRGGCFFSQKTLACQKAGAVAAVIIDTEFEPLAAVNWVGSHPPDSHLDSDRRDELARRQQAFEENVRRTGRPRRRGSLRVPTKGAMPSMRSGIRVAGDELLDSMPRARRRVLFKLFSRGRMRVRRDRDGVFLRV